MSSTARRTVTTLPLEKPASIRRQFPGFAEQGWMIPDFICGPENASLQYLFDSSTLDDLCSLSPIVLYGDNATGKTALAITLAVRWARRSRLRPLCFATGSSFCQDYHAAVEIDDIASFRTRYRHPKLLVIDGCQAITLRVSTLVEFVHTIDHLKSEQTPLIVTCNKLPAALDKIDSGLSSRLSEGYSTPVERPGIEARKAILKRLVSTIDDKLDVEHLATFCENSSIAFTAPQLMQVVHLAHQNRNSQGEIDFQVLPRLVTQAISGAQLTIADISRLVAKKLKVRLTDLRGSTRESRVVRARGLAMLLARKLTSTSLQEIGQFFGGRDHSTVLHACRKTAKSIEQDSELSGSLTAIQTELLNR